jgi:hypothetical protein
MLSIIEAFIIAMTMGATLSGVYFASFLLCLRWLIFSDDGGTLRKPIHRPFLIITLILFAFTVIALGINLQRTLNIQSNVPTLPPTTTANINVSNPIIESLPMG